MSNYSKFKERNPQDTVYEIQRILNDARIFTVVRWTSGVETGAASCRVTPYPLEALGQNGKGTDQLYASASGYAEFMERMQNMWLGQRLHSPALHERCGFREFPDERLMNIGDVLAQEDPYLSDVFAKLKLRTGVERYKLLRSFAKEYYERTDGKIPVVPFVDVFGDDIVWLPFAVVVLFGLANGMTAGNTLEEALVQGTSEVYERYVQLRLLAGGLTPPEIPREVLQGYSFWPLVEQIEESGRYRVSVRDCSLGEGFPVTATIIHDLHTGSFGIKPGCHPSFAVAVERTLTEAFQGRTLEQFCAACHVGSDAEVKSYHNTINVVKLGIGAYPQEMVSDEPSWEYGGWSQWEGLSNSEYLVRLLKHARQRGLRPLVRDSSHMGFPSYQIVIPGIHEVYPISDLRVRDFWTQLHVSESLNHFPNLTQEEEERMLLYMTFKQSTVEHGMGIPYMHYFLGDAYAPDRMLAFLALKHRRFDLAENVFHRLAQLQEVDSVAWGRYNALAMYARLRQRGNDATKAQRLLGCLVSPEFANYVIKLTEDEDRILERAFPRALKCFDCANCELKEKDCEYPAVEVVYERIKDAMSSSKVSVDELRKALRPYADAAMSDEVHHEETSRP